MEAWRTLAQTQGGNQGNNQQLTGKYCQELPRKSTPKLHENNHQKYAGKQLKLTIYPRKKAGANKGMVNRKQVFESDTDEGEDENKDVVHESLLMTCRADHQKKVQDFILSMMVLTIGLLFRFKEIGRVKEIFGLNVNGMLVGSKSNM